MEVRFFPGAYGGYGVMAALEFVELSEAVRVRLATLLKPENRLLIETVFWYRNLDNLLHLEYDRVFNKI
jgi:hypothetical protein